MPNVSNLFRIIFFCFVFTEWIPSDLWACDRPRVDSRVITALADRIVSAEVENISKNGEVAIRILNNFKGSGPATISVRGIHTERRSRFEPCQAVVVSSKKSYLFFLMDSLSGETFYRPIDPNDGVFELTKDIILRLQSEIMDSGKHSSWIQTPLGLFISLVSPKAQFKKDENIDLDLAFFNPSLKPILFRYRTWPPEAHTYCELVIKSKVKISESISVDSKDARDYFSKHGHHYDLDILPNYLHHFNLLRINSAKMGWGYKEEFGFKYYPLEPGNYKVHARCRGFSPSPIDSGIIDLKVIP